MHYVVDFKVDWPKLLFKSRLQIPCRDIIHVATSISRRDINLSLCSFQLMSSDVATSLYAFVGFNWSLMMSRHQSLVATSAQVFCSLQLVVHDVATSISFRDINLMNCNFQLMVPDVATSIPCRDISSYLCSFQLMSFVVATSILCRDLTSCLCRFHWLLLVSRHQSPVLTTA